MKTPARLLLVAAAGALLVACTPGSGGLGSLPPVSASPSAPASPEPSVPDVTPGPVSPSPSPSAPPTSGPSASPTTAPTPTPVETVVVRAYFLLGSDGLVPVLREVPRTVAVGTAAMNQLLAGPNRAERDAGISSAIPDASALRGLAIKDRTATVDLTSTFESGGGTASVTARLAQVVYTLTQFSSVDRVTFRIDGREVTVFSSEGLVLDGPKARADFVDELPAIWVDRPAWGASLGNPGRVTGSANVFEAQFRVALLDARGAQLVDEPVMATCGTGCRGTFDVTLHYDVTRAQYGTLRVYDLSAKDGRPENVREYRVWLTPEH